MATLHSLTLKNFKKHRELHLDFTDGLNVVRGPNYAGKSTLTQAIFCALKGVSAVPGGRKVAVTWGESDFEVTLVLTLPAGRATVKRSLSNARVEIDGAVVATGHTAVNAYLADALGMDPKQLEMLSYSPQGDTAALLTLGAARIQQAVEEMAGVELIDQVLERASSENRRLEGALETLSEVDPAPIMAEIEALSARLSEAENAIAPAETQLQAASEAKTAAQQALDAGIAQNQARERGLRARAKAEAALEAAQHELERARVTLEALPAQREGADEELLAEVTRLQGEVATLERAAAERETLQRELAQYAAWLPQAEEKRGLQAGLAGQLQEAAAAEQAALEAQREAERAAVQAQALVKKLRAAVQEAVCHTCKRPFDAAHAERAKAELDLASSNSAELERQFDKITADFEHARKAHRELKQRVPSEDWAGLIAQRQAQAENWKRRLEQLPEGGAAGRAAELRAAQAALAEHRTAADRYRSTRLTYSAAMQRVSEAEAALGRVGEIPEAVAVETLAQVEREAAQTETAAREALQAARHAVASLRPALEQKRAALEAAQSETQRAEGLRKRHALVKGFVKYLRDNRARFLADIWAGVMDRASHFCSQVTGGAVAALRREDDAFVYVEDGNALPIEAASGCQKAVAGTGLRLALESSFFGQGGFLILDEPSADMNDVHAAALAGALSAEGRQTLLITHRDGEEYSAQQVITL